MRTMQFIFLIFFLSFINLTAQVTQKICKAGTQNAFTVVEAPQVYLNRKLLEKIATTSFIVDYDTNVPTAARTAFNKAVDIWSYLIVLSKPVKIKVSFVNEPTSGMLGGTTMKSWRNNFTSAPVYDMQYPIPLAKHLDNSISYNDYDFTMVFNGAQNFNYETNGIPVENKFDFVSVALHEIGHGLGLFGSMYVDQNNGYFGLSGYPIVTQEIYPAITDKFYISGSTRLIDVTSANTLGQLLLSNNVFFDGTNAKNANNNQNVKLYAPSQWEGGSSIDHLDEDTFPYGDPNSLMTPFLDMAEVVHNPGEIFLGILKDYGHTVGRIITFNTPSSSNQIVKGQNYNITWHDNISGFGDYIDFDLYKITSGDPLLISTINTNAIWSNPGVTGNSYNWLVPNALENNFYIIRAVGFNHTVDYGQSNVFVISNIPESPHFNPPGSQYPSPLSVQLFTNSPVSEIRYVIGDAEPTQTSTLYNQLIPIPTGTTRIRAKSFLVLADNTKVESPTSDANYFIGANSFVAEFQTTTNNYGNIYYKSSNDSYSDIEYNIIKAGRNSELVYRSYAKWSGFRSIIPANAIIQSVEFYIPFYPVSSNGNIQFRYYNPTPGSGPTQIWQHINYGSPIATKSADTWTFSISGFVQHIQNVVNGTGSDYFGLAIKNANEYNSSDYVYHNGPITMKVYYRGNVEVTQFDKDDVPFGQIAHWNGTVWENKDVPATLFKSGTVSLRSYEDYRPYSSIKQKYHDWLDKTDVVNHNHFSIINGEINYFTADFEETYLSPKIMNYYPEAPSLNPTTDKIWVRDPWFIDKPDGIYGYRNGGMAEANWNEKNSPLDFSSPEFSNYRGVFINQLISSGTYYKLWAGDQQINLGGIGTRQFYFQNWTASGASLQPYGTGNEVWVVFTSPNDAVVKANYKGSQLSNTSGTNPKTSQSKFIRTTEGHLHNVYESMGDIWYEKSTDNGATWQIMNGGKPINPDYENNEAKSPSITSPDDGNNLFYITYQSTEDEYDWPGVFVMLTQYKNGSLNWHRTVYDLSDYSFNTDFQQVIAALNNVVLVVFNPPAPLTPGLMAKEYLISPGPNYTVSNEYTRTLPVVGANSSSPTITAGNGKYHLAYQDAVFTIRYLRWGVNTNPSSSYQYSIVSNGSGDNLNYEPSISLANYNPVISWKGSLYTGTTHAVLRRGTLSGSSMVWGDFLKVGNNTNYIHNNSTFTTTEKTVMCWSENYLTKWVSRTYSSGSTYYSTPGILSHLGISTQVTKGSDLATMKALVFCPSVPIYFYTLSTTNFGQLQSEEDDKLNKITVEDSLVTFGRSGIVDLNGVEFVFNIGDVIVDDSIITFLEKPDTIIYSSSEQLNEYTRTNNFALNSSSNFYFTNIYYVEAKSNPDTALVGNETVSFKAELVSVVTDQVVGVFDNILYNANNLEKYANVDYMVDCSGIMPGEYYLRLVTEVNGQANYSLANIIRDNTVLAKKNFNEVNFNGQTKPESYELSQNYPNPFNPVTTIKYQILQDGIVNIKIYDILGKEVKTLVNEQKLTGKYEIKFDASDLASGVYIYRIQVNDFISSKKMMLLK